MQISLQNLSKRFGNEWIFQNLTHTFATNAPCAVIGANGSGKSTLLYLVAGLGQATAGKVVYTLPAPSQASEVVYTLPAPSQASEVVYTLPAPAELPAEAWYKYIAISAPYLELIEEFTLAELVRFHTQFKPLRAGVGRQDFLELIQLAHAKDKLVKHFSSGMKQRLKLGLVFYSQMPVLLLDEPTTNLDAQGIIWYKNTLANNIQDRLCVICSNQPEEYEICTQKLNLMDFKPYTK